MCKLLLFLILFSPFYVSAQIQPLTPWWTESGPADTVALGLSVAGLGDINSDGYDDMIVGTEEDRLWIFHGGTTPDSLVDGYLNNPDTDPLGYEFEGYVFNIGDVNGDSWDDIAVKADTAFWHYKKFYIYYAGAAFDTIPDLVIGKPEIERPYRAVGIGDFNGDGGNDFALVDPDYNVGSGIYGRLQIFWGGSSLDSLPDWEITASQEFNGSPSECIGLGDLDFNGCAEIAVGASNFDAPGGISNIGNVQIFYGADYPDEIPDYQLFGIEQGEAFGQALVAIDINYDNISELFVFSYREIPPDYPSSILIYNLFPQPDTLYDYYIGAGPYELGGNPHVVDFNGDGYEDLIKASTGYGGGNGVIHIWLNGDGLDEFIDCAMYGQWMDEKLGLGLANIGDFNGDGIDDIGAGAPGYLGGNPGRNGHGRVHVILGDTTYHQSAGIKETSNPIPTSEILLNVYPNPFNSQVTIAFDLPV
ncbi:integrin alpha, partial [bacterium]|nr:integrin alpha [bacterium]